MIRAVIGRARAAKSRIPRIAVERFGVPPAWLGYRFWQRETLAEHAARTGRSDLLQVIHPARIHTAPLPLNVTDPDALPTTRGWWGFSFRDVPTRHNDPTLLTVLADCTLAHYRETADHPFSGDYYVGILTADQRALELREIRFRPKHAEILNSAPRLERIARATWVTERVYHNYSHWLTAHLPKLVLLRDRGELEDVLLPPELPETHRASLRMLGLRSEDFRTFDPRAVQSVGEMRIFDTDRFRPELLRPVREAFTGAANPAPRRRIFISRATATRRRLLNEPDIGPMLARAGFERVLMEELDFQRQVELMADTAILFAPHGAGLTNMMFCPEGAHIVEIADLSFPNPNFYALASAMGHNYWLIEGAPIGTQHPLQRDMSVDPGKVRDVLAHLEAVTS